MCGNCAKVPEMKTSTLQQHQYKQSVTDGQTDDEQSDPYVAFAYSHKNETT